MVPIGPRANRATLVFFLSPTCPVCKKLLPVVQSIRDAESGWLDIVLASDGGSPEQHDRFAPPLVDDPLWSGLGDNAPVYLGSVVLGGLTGRITVAGTAYIGLAMPHHDWLEDDKILDIAAYVLGELNGVAPRLDAETLAGLRAAPLDGPAIHALRKEALE